MLVALWLATGGRVAVWASAPVQVVRPEDVATPTPTVEVVLLPTVTPVLRPEVTRTPHAPEPVVGGGTYVVKVGDTLWSVAIEVGLDLQEMPCSVAPAFRPEQPLVIGDTLDLLPPGWRCHEVAGGETLAGIAETYGVTPAQIEAVTWNQLAQGDASLVPGRFLRIPPANGDTQAASSFLAYMLDQPVGVSPMLAYATGGPRRVTQTTMGPLPKNWPYGSGVFMWPVYGWLSQPYRDDHRAVDIAAPVGTFVTAADRGVVVRAGWNDQGYGLFVVIDHNIDYVTLYSHLDEVFVSEGEVVAQGHVIGTVGSTGNSTGPHLHFEIRDFGRRTNPLGLLVR
jgi:murein DD-endopeptidase MepM/ murein hydrolase activator NlpD